MKYPTWYDCSDREVVDALYEYGASYGMAFEIEESDYPIKTIEDWKIFIDYGFTGAYHDGIIFWVSHDEIIHPEKFNLKDMNIVIKDLTKIIRKVLKKEREKYVQLELTTFSRVSPSLFRVGR